MADNRYTPELIARGNLRFAIPVYQRLFAWRRNEVRKLLFDLKAHFENHKEGAPYYLGMMTVIANNRGGYDLIDGQQRFTVMMLMAIVFCEHDRANCWKRFAVGEDDAVRLEFAARSDDNDYIGSRIRGAASNGYVNRNMQEAIGCIESFYNGSDAEGGLTTDEERTSFARNIFERLTFFLAELPDSYAAHPASLNKYFEVMNSAGKGLEQHEILLVDLLRGESDQQYLTRIWKLVEQLDTPVVKRRDQVDSRTYANDFKDRIVGYRNGDFSDIGGDDPDSSDRKGAAIGEIEAKPLDRKVQFYESRERCMLDFPELLLLVLDLTLDAENKKPETFSAFQFYRKDKLLSNFKQFGIRNRKAFFERLLLVRALLDYYVVRRDFVDGQGNYTLIYRDRGDEDSENRDRLRQYQSMLFVSTDFYKWLKPFVEFLMKTESPDAETMLAKLKSIDGEIHEMPASENWSYGKIDRYWFWRVDYCLWNHRNELFGEYARIVACYVFRENRSIEHLHPQDQSHNAQWQESKIDSFGNLAMISPSFNSLQSNDHIQVKFARIREQIDNKTLQSIKLLKMCMAANFDYTKWTPDLAEKHEQEMIDMLISDR